MGIRGIISKIKEVVTKMFKRDAQETFQVNVLLSAAMERELKLWEDVYFKRPPWAKDDIKTIGLAKVIASETARLATLELEITVGGSARAVYLQQQIDGFKDKIRKYLEYACAFGGIVLKPNGGGIDYISPKNFLVTNTDSNGNVDGGIFLDCITKGDKHYTRLEYHRFITIHVEGKAERVYTVTNKAFVSDSETEKGKEISIKSVPEWAHIEGEVAISNIKKPLFSYVKMPMANGIDMHSPLGVSIFSDAIEELKDLDIAYSRNAKEIKDSSRIVMTDGRIFNEPGTRVGTNTNKRDERLPSFVINVDGADTNEIYHEINPTLNTETRISGINKLLSFISYKCGFSNGYFSFDQSRGLVTATQVEAEDKRTIETISDIRTSLKSAIDDLLYALDKYADLYGLAPYGTYEVSYYFKDITVTFAEDRQRYYSLAMAGKFPWKKYYVDYEGYSEEEAKKLLQMLKAENKTASMFEEE